MDSKPRTVRKCLWIMLGGIVLLASGLFYYDAFLVHPQGKGPVAIAVKSPNGSPLAEPVVLIGIGDSVTAGFGARPGWGYFDRLFETPVGDWPDVAEKSLHAKWPKLVKTNLAVSGSISIQHEARIDRMPTFRGHGIVVMTSGGNDLIHSYGKQPPREGAMYGAGFEQAKPWIASFEKRYDRMIAKVTTHFPDGCEIYVGTIYDPSDGTGVLPYTGLPAWPDAPKILASYNDIIRRLPSRFKNVHVVEIHDAFMGHGLHSSHFWEACYDKADPHCWMFDNIEDPNERGYDAIRRLFLNCILAP